MQFGKVSRYIDVDLKFFRDLRDPRAPRSELVQQGRTATCGIVARQSHALQNVNGRLPRRGFAVYALRLKEVGAVLVQQSRKVFSHVAGEVVCRPPEMCCVVGEWGSVGNSSAEPFVEEAPRHKRPCLVSSG